MGAPHRWTIEMDKGTLSQEIIELSEKSKLPEEMELLIRNSKLSRRAQIVVKHILDTGDGKGRSDHQW